jgi:hypothetical protein
LVKNLFEKKNKLGTKYTSLLQDVKQWMDATDNPVLKQRLSLVEGRNLLREEKKELEEESWKRRREGRNTCCLIF